MLAAGRTVFACAVVVCAVAEVRSQGPLRALGVTTPQFEFEKIVDVDGGGAADMASFTTSTFGLNDGTGTRFPLAAPGAFGAAAVFGVPPVPHTPGSQFRVRDLNNDGLPDYVDVGKVALRSPAPVGFALSQTFAFATAGAFGTALDVGDVDNDGDADVVMAVSAPAGFVPWFNDGLGGFAAGPFSAIAGGTAATFCHLRDVDLDGDLDALLFSDVASSPVPGTLFLNTGGFFAASLLPAPFPSIPPSTGPALAFPHALGDFDGDGRTDFAVAHNAPPTPGFAVSIVLNGPTGFGAPAVTFLPLTPASPFYIPSLMGLIAVDVDGDAKDELLTSYIADAYRVEVRPVGPGGAVGPPSRVYPALPLPLAAGSYDLDSLRDLDGDGDLDLFAAYGTTVLPMMNDGAGGFVFVGDDEPHVSAIYANPVFGDFDGDGNLDAVDLHWPVATAPSGIRTAFGDVSGRMTPGPDLLGPPWSDAIAFDFDLDGDSDLYGFEPFPVSGNDLLYVASGGGFVATTLAWSTRPKSCHTTLDLDADGDLDLCVGRHPTNVVFAPTTTLLLRNVGGVLTAPISVGANAWTVDVAQGDFDADGLVDVLQVNQTPGLTSFVYLNAAGPATPVAQPAVVPGFAACADLDGDGDTDAAVGSTLYAANAGVLTPLLALPATLAGPGAFADLNGDGLLDLVDSRGTVMLATAPFAFAPPSVPPFGSLISIATRGPTLVDVDRDGDLDFYGSGPRLATNVTRQLAHANEVRIGYPTQIDVYGSPGSVALLFAAPNPATFVAAPGLTVLIDPATAQFVAPIALGAAGSANPGFSSLPLFVPNAPALVGLSLHWQAVETTQGRLTNRLTSTIRSF
jgi:hypothetical protein